MEDVSASCASRSKLVVAMVGIDDLYTRILADWFKFLSINHKVTSFVKNDEYELYVREKNLFCMCILV